MPSTNAKYTSIRTQSSQERVIARLEFRIADCGLRIQSSDHSEIRNLKSATRLRARRPRERLVEPQNWLADEEVADDFLDIGVGGQGTPEVDVIVAVEREAGKQQARVTHRPRVGIHQLGRVRPPFAIPNVRSRERPGSAHAAAVGQLEAPEIVR